MYSYLPNCGVERDTFISFAQKWGRVVTTNHCLESTPNQRLEPTPNQGLSNAGVEGELDGAPAHYILRSLGTLTPQSNLAHFSGFLRSPSLNVVVTRGIPFVVS